jgi:hypothetical protein
LRTTENKLKYNEAKVVYKFLTDMRATSSWYCLVIKIQITKKAP